MVALSSLWLPIILSAVIVWVASAVVWMALPHHKADFKRLANEDAVRNALRQQNVTPGQYTIPYAQGSAAMKDPEVIRKFEEGPAAFLTIVPSGKPAMGKPMVLSFVYYIVIGIFVAYVASRTLAPATEYLQVFRVTGTVAFLAYGGAVITEANWFGRPWSTTWKMVADALLYGLLTAGAFGWLWPG